MAWQWLGRACRTPVAINVLVLAATVACQPAAASLEPTASTAPTPQQASSPLLDPTDVAPTGTVVLTDTGCAFESALEAVPPGPLAITFDNQTAEGVAFHVWKLAAGHPFEEFSAFVARHHDEMEKGNDTGPPDFASIRLQQPVPKDERRTVTIAIAAGTYGVACAVSNEIARRLVATYAAGPIEVAAS
jgi:hypothetical protein